MRKRFTSILLALTLCLGLLAVPAAAAEQKITVGDETYEVLLGAILSETEADDVTARLDSDVTLTAAVVIGSSDYGGLFAEPATVTAKNVTVDLNGYTLTGAPDSVIFEVQEGYTLTIVDSSADKTGKLVSLTDVEVDVREGGTYYPLTAEAPAAPETPAENPFTDVSESAYYYAPVLWAVEKGITTGKTETTFAPNETCSVAHILTFLWQANGSPAPTIENPFTDVKDTDYYYQAALWAYEKELVSGNVFTGAAPCTRGQAVLFFYLLAGSPAVEASTFTDIAPDSVYSRAVSWAVSQGITNGTSDTTFGPDTVCTRGNIVTFLYRDAQAE